MDLHGKKSCNKFGVQSYLMQNLFNAHTLKTGLRLVVVLVISFILVNLLA
jgi:hypothetical protein